MKKSKIIITGISIFFAILIIYYIFFAKFIAVPNKIIIYKNGNTTEVSRNNPLFKQIVSCMNSRISFDSGLVKLGIDKDWEDKIKNDEMGVEFIYSSKETFRLKNLPFRTFSYTKLFFPIQSNDVNNENLMFFSRKDNYYNGYHSGPISLSPCSSKLTKLLNGIK